MKHLLSTLTIIIYLVAIILFASGIVVTSLGIYDFFHSFHHLRADGNLPVDMIVTGILKAVDLFLIGVVIFMFSLGLLILFRRKSAPLPDELPDWLRVKDFLHLKIVLWEAILSPCRLLPGWPCRVEIQRIADNICRPDRTRGDIVTGG